MFFFFTMTRSSEKKQTPYVAFKRDDALDE